MQNPIRTAIEAAGGLTAAANALKVSATTVFTWSKQGRIPRLDKARLLSKLSGVPVESLRPLKRAA